MYGFKVKFIRQFLSRWLQSLLIFPPPCSLTFSRSTSPYSLPIAWAYLVFPFKKANTGLRVWLLGKHIHTQHALGPGLRLQHQKETVATYDLIIYPGENSIMYICVILIRFYCCIAVTHCVYNLLMVDIWTISNLTYIINNSCFSPCCGKSSLQKAASARRGNKSKLSCGGKSLS